MYSQEWIVNAYAELTFSFLCAWEPSPGNQHQLEQKPIQSNFDVHLLATVRPFFICVYVVLCFADCLCLLQHYMCCLDLKWQHAAYSSGIWGCSLGHINGGHSSFAESTPLIWSFPNLWIVLWIPMVWLLDWEHWSQEHHYSRLPYLVGLACGYLFSSTLGFFFFF